MAKEVFYDETYKEATTLKKGEYEACVFENCTLNGFNLEYYDFMDCEFVDCDLSGALITRVSFKNVQFYGCKLMGLQFDTANPFLLEVHFKNCQLQMSNFYLLKLARTRFVNCQMEQVDFAEADLTAASFKDCNLAGAIFDNTQLAQADFSTALNFNINPGINKLKGAKFSKEGLLGLVGGLGIEIVD